MTKCFALSDGLACVLVLCSDLAHVVGWVMMVLIVLSVSAFIVGTMPRFRYSTHLLT